MSRADDAVARIEALLAVGLRLARSAPSGRLVLSRIHEAIDPAWLVGPNANDLLAELGDADRTAREPLDRRTVERILRDAWGGSPTDEVDDLDLETPVAVTATAQVHRGELDGAAVAVKVLRPGIAASVRQDLALLDGLLSPLAAAFPALDTRALLAEVRERVLEELDLEQEASTARRFHRALRRHPFLAVPAPHTSLARETVAVSDWIEGTPLEALGSAEARNRAAARLIVFVLGGIREGLVHADPQPGDVLVDGDGRLTVLDLGAARAVEPTRADLAAEVVDAFAAGDGDRLGAIVERAGVLPAGEGPRGLEFARSVLGDHAREGATRLDAAAVIAVAGRAAAHPDLGPLVAAGRLPAADLWPLRGAGQLFGTVARLGAEGDWLALVRAALRDGWSAEA